MSERNFIVVYDDKMDMCMPYAFSKECRGALEPTCAGGILALFKTRKDARKAINISAAFARLQISQGVSYNHDFLGVERVNVRVLECKELE